MRKVLIPLTVLAVVGGGVALATTGTSQASTKALVASDPSGLITCPITGEAIPAEECPLCKKAAEEAKRASDANKPPCCRGK